MAETRSSALASAPIASVEGLTKSFSDKQILKDVNFSVEKGEVLAILGPSGSGKTTLLRCVNALETPDSGVVSVDGSSIDYSQKVKQRSILELRRKTAMVFQSYNLFKNRTAVENVTEGLRVVHKLGVQEATKIGMAALEDVGMAEFADRYPNQLSGGQQQRVSIARSMALNPSVILFDEPTSALDPELVGDVLQSITAVANKGVTMIIVTHEVGFAKHVANRAIFMDGGVIVEGGNASQIIDHPQTERVQAFLSKIELK